MDQLQTECSYDFDYDNQIIATEKYDTKCNYRKHNGYFTGIAILSDKIVYIENRDDNANLKFEQASTLTRAYKLLIDNRQEGLNNSYLDI